MRDWDEIILAVFNEQNLEDEEEEILEKENKAIYDFYNNNTKFKTELLVGLSKDLQHKISDIKTFSICEVCNTEYQIRYKYRPYLEWYDTKFCDECINKIALDYAYLRQIEEELENVLEIHSNLETVQIYEFNKISNILKAIIKNREEKGRFLSEYSDNYALGLDKISAYYECNDNTIYIKSNSDKGELLSNISCIETFNIDNIKYDIDCKNIELRFKDYCKRPYYFAERGLYYWIVPKGKSIILNKYYDGDFRNSKINFE
ncbi:MAG: hypothetical protein F8N38_07725 [Hungatella sp.]|nr:hypothetical protein [Hungatella sp.]